MSPEYMQRDKYTFFLIDRSTESDSPEEAHIVDSLVELRPLLTDNLLACGYWVAPIVQASCVEENLASSLL